MKEARFVCCGWGRWALLLVVSRRARASVYDVCSISAACQSHSLHSLHSLSDAPQPIDFRTATITDEKTAVLSFRSAIGLAWTAVLRSRLLC